MIHASAHADTASASSRTLRPGRFVLVLLGLALLLTALVPATASQAKVPKGFFGLAQGGSANRADYRQMQDIEVRTFRLTVNWNRVQPSRGAFAWGPTDAHVAALAQSGITAVPMVVGAPQWATGSGYFGVPPLKGDALRAWKSFLKAVVKRYKKGGEFWTTHPSVPAKPVKKWQIWNEPNLSKYFAKAGTSPPKSVPKAAKAYGKFIKASDKAIRKADKRAKVVLAGLSGNVKKRKMEPNKFIKKFLKVNKVTKHFDVAALHPYAPSVKKYKKRIAGLRRALNRGGAKKKEISLTEVGWGSEKNGQRLNKGLAGQAKLLKKSFKQTVKYRKKWKIDQLYWFDWRDPPGSAPVGCSFCPSAGLLHPDGKEKPAYRKFKRFTKMQRGRASS